MNPHVLYDKPHLGQKLVGELTLGISGFLRSALPSVAYEGRLQVHNRIGKIQSVRQVAGDTLPSGWALSFDEDTSEVVLTWPAYSPVDTPVQDYSFENEPSAWELGKGYSIFDAGSPGDYRVRSGEKSLQYDGFGISYTFAKAFTPTTPGERITYTGYVKQGASSANAMIGAAGLAYYDENFKEIVKEPANVYKSSDGVPNFAPSGEISITPSGASYVKPFAVFNRKRQHRPAWFDDFTWDKQGGGEGTNTEQLLALSIQVIDSKHRAAIWSGTVKVVTPTWDFSWSSRRMDPLVQNWYAIYAPETLPYVVIFYRDYYASQNKVGKIDRDGVLTTINSPLDIGESMYDQGITYVPATELYWGSGIIAGGMWNTKDFVTFNTVPTSPGTYSLVWGEGAGIFVATSQSLYGIRYSTNGSTWTTVDFTVSVPGYDPAGTGAGGGAIYQVAWSEPLGLFCAISPNGQVVTSPDGITWTLRRPRDPTNTWANTPRIIWAGGATQRFVIAGHTRYITWSDDGINWTDVYTTYDVGNTTAISYCPPLNMLLCGGVYNGVVYSTDGGDTWTTSFLAQPPSYTAFSNGVWSDYLAAFIYKQDVPLGQPTIYHDLFIANVNA